jgi:hypothetical protein
MKYDQKANEIGALLGCVAEFRNPCGAGETFKLTHSDGPTLRVVFGVHPHIDKVTVSVAWPEDAQSYRQVGDHDLYPIKLTMTRSAETLARDIRRRLLTPLLNGAWQKSLDMVAESNAKTDRQKAMAVRLATTAGDTRTVERLASGDDSPRRLHLTLPGGRGRYAAVSVSGDSQTTSINLPYLPTDVVNDMLAFLCARLQAKGN